MVKKISIINVFLMLLTLPVFSQSSTGDVWFVPQDTVVATNRSFTIEVHTNSGTNRLAAYGFDITFDSGLIGVDTSVGTEGVEAGSDGFVAAVNPSNPDSLIISGFETGGTGPGTNLHVVTINFTAGPESGTTALGITVRDLTNENTDSIGNPRGIEGSITISDVLPGDVNDNGNVDIVDALLTAQHYVGLEPSGFNPSAADVNCDNAINIVDALLIAQYYVGLITEFPCGTSTPVPTTPPTITDAPTATPDNTNIPTQGPGGNTLKVQYKCAETNASAQQIKPHMNIINTGSSGVSLSGLTLRYYYTKEGTTAEEFHVDYAVPGSGNITGSFQSGYCEIGFTTGAGSIPANGQTGEMQIRFNKADWSSYDQSNDYSFEPSITSFTDFDRITLYQDGALVWGTGDDGSTPVPTEAPTDTPVPTETPVPTDTPVPTATPEPGNPDAIMIEVEDYDRYYDLDSANQGLRYRPDEGVDLEDCYEGGFNICWVQANEWLEFDVTVNTAGTYNIWARVSNGDTSTSTFHIEIDGTDVTGTVSVQPTGDWQAWTNVQAASGVSISSGNHTVRLSIDNLGNNIDFIYISNTSGAPPARTPVPPPAGFVKPVDTHGYLQLVGNTLCDESGDPVQLRGMSSHDIRWHWFAKDHTVQNLAYGWGANLIRAAMYTDPGNGGYIDSPTLMKQRVVDIVENAIEAGIYVIVDWHILNDGDPNTYASQARSFFNDMSRTYGSYPNLIWEICNEPNGPQWSQIKSYAQSVIQTIRGNDPDNIIIVGTPNWSQDVDLASNDPITGYDHIMYALHFYAGTHTQWLRDKANTAMSNGIAIFVTEFGTCDASGGGSYNFTEAQNWMDWMATNNISWANWALCNKNEAASALREPTGISGPWSTSDCTQTGQWIKDRL